MKIEEGGLDDPEVHALLEEHLADMFRISPPESVHALDLSGLRRPEITFWTIRLDGALAGCGALKELGPDEGEVKSMRTAHAFRGRGVAKALLEHLLHEARRRGYARLFLETGAQPEFEPARRLYERFGFRYRGPFQGYREDPHSVFMERDLDPAP